MFEEGREVGNPSVSMLLAGLYFHADNQDGIFLIWPSPPICSNAISWWRHQMETFSALLALCAGNSPVTGEFPKQRSVTRSFDVFFDAPEQTVE